MTTPATIDFDFKWAYIGSAYTTMQYTSNNYIPIWNYNKLKKIVVTNSSNTNLKFILFDKTRGTSNPAISTASSLDLKYELYNFERLLDLGGNLYGQTYISMDYIRILNDRLETGWRNWTDRSFNVTYTYDFFEYDITQKGALPLQFIFDSFFQHLNTNFVNVKYN
jgi:hypothetical protein